MMFYLFRVFMLLGVLTAWLLGPHKLLADDAVLCTIKLPAVSNPSLHTDVLAMRTTSVDCNAPMYNMVLSRLALNGVDLTQRAVNAQPRGERSFDLGLDIRSLARVGDNLLEVEFGGLSAATLLERQFTIDPLPPLISVQSQLGRVSIRITDAHSPIKDVSIVRLSPSQGILENQLDELATKAIDIWSDRDQAYNYSSELGLYAMVSALDQAGNVTSAMLDGSSVEGFRQRLSGLQNAEREAQFQASRASPGASLGGDTPSCNLKLAVAYVNPGGESDQVLIERLGPIKEAVLSVLNLFEREFELNSHSIPNFAADSCADLRFYLRPIGSSEARAVSWDSSGLTYGDRIEVVPLPPGIEVLSPELLSQMNLSALEGANPRILNPITEPILNHARRTAWGGQGAQGRVLVFYDLISPDDNLAFHGSGTEYCIGSRLLNLPTLVADSRALSAFSPRLGRVIAHELGHSFDLNHTAGELLPTGSASDFWDHRFSNLMFASATGNLDKQLTLPQVRRVVGRMCGEPELSLQGPSISVGFGTYAYGRVDDREIYGSGQRSNRPITGIPLSSSGPIPGYSMSSFHGTIPSIHLVPGSLSLPLSHFSRLFEIGNMVYSEPHAGYRVFLPGRINPRDGRYPRAIPGRTWEDTFTVLANVRSVTIGVQSLATGMFAPYWRPDRPYGRFDFPAHRPPPVSVKDWAFLAGEGTSSVTVSVPPGEARRLIIKTSIGELGSGWSLSISLGANSATVARWSTLAATTTHNNDSKGFALVVRQDELSPMSGELFLAE